MTISVILTVVNVLFAGVNIASVVVNMLVRHQTKELYDGWLELKAEAEQLIAEIRREIH